MLSFEAALTDALRSEGEITGEVCQQVTDILGNSKPDLPHLLEAASRDGVIVPELVRQVRDRLPADCRTAFHRGATSQDAVMPLVEFHRMPGDRLQAVDDGFARIAEKFGDQDILARTRMQKAGRQPASRRITAWCNALAANLSEIPRWQDRISLLQLAGPIGDRESMPLGIADRIAAHMARQPGLRDPGQGWHTDRSHLVSCSSWLSGLSGIPGKFGQDFCPMAQSGEIDFAGGGTSSSIPGKNNPVAAETLVVLARSLGAGLRHAPGDHP